jgi:ABC-type multidrug transport system permease subunit
MASEKVSSESSSLGVTMVQELIQNLNDIKSSLIEQKSKINSIPTNLEEINNLEAGINNPVSELENIIDDLEDYSNSSEINSEISDLKELTASISGNFENIEASRKKVQELQSKINVIIAEIDSLINSINSFEIGDAQNMVSPIAIDLQAITPTNTKREYIIPPIISLISLFGAMLLSSTFILKNKKTLAYFRNFMTPTRDSAFVLATYLSCLFILFIQFVFVFLGIYFIFGMNFFAIPLEMIAILILGWSAFIFIGIFLGYTFKSEETIIFSSVLTASVLLFFSNIIMPLENISGRLLQIAEFNPLVLFENSLKKIYLFSLGFDFLLKEISILLAFIFSFGILAYFMRKLNKRDL